METWLVPFLLLSVILSGFQVKGIRDELQSVRQRLWEMDAKLDAVLTHAGIQFDPYADVPVLVVEALRAGNKIEAIKQYRDAKRVGLREAKEYVDELQRRSATKTC
jgi:hypothetical protein